MEDNRRSKSTVKGKITDDNTEFTGRSFQDGPLSFKNDKGHNESHFSSVANDRRGTDVNNSILGHY